MILWWLKRFFATYRHEGVLPVAQTLSELLAPALREAQDR